MNDSIKKYFGYITVLIISLSYFHCTNSNHAINGSGTIEVDDVNISSLVPGRIKNITVEEGDIVKAGDTIIVLSGNEIEADVAAANAAMDAVKGNVEAAKSNYSNAKTELARAKELFQSGSVTKQQLDQAVNRYTIAGSQLRSAEAQLRQNKAIISRANTRFKETIIQSPINGVVLARNFQPGEVVLPGSFIMTVADISKVYLKLYVKETELARIKLGAKGIVEVDGHDNDFPAKVTYISSRAEFTPKNVQTQDARTRLVYAVKLSINNESGILKPGMPADGKIVFKDK